MASEYYDKKIETMKRSDLEKLQLRRLKWQVRRCYEKSELYRAKFQKAGVKPQDIRSLKDIAKIPVIRKQELREEQAAFPPFGRSVISPKKDWREMHPTTGTTGAPVKVIWSAKDVENIAAHTARTLWCSGVRPGDIIQNAFSYGLWVAGLSVHYAASMLNCFVIPIGATLTNRQIDYLTNPASTVLMATPSYALYIGERMRERGITPKDIKLRVGSFGGEGGVEVPSTRKRIEESLGIDAFDIFGAAEISPTMASECKEKAGLHWTEDQHFAEILDPETMEPCAPGEKGVLVLTHLTREATPMIRYWTNDLAVLEVDKCGCGRTHARSPGGITGRADDMIIFKGAKFYPSQVEKVVRAHPELGNEFRIELAQDQVTRLETCTIVAELLDPSANPELTKEALEKNLKDELLVTPEVRLERAGVLERTEFKAKRIVDKRQSA